MRRWGEPDDFSAVANIIYDLGYETVNWNLGCPYKMVANKQRGSGLSSWPRESGDEPRR